MKQNTNDYLFCGHAVTLQLPASIDNAINIVAAESVSSLRSKARTVAQAFSAEDTDSIIGYVQIKRTAEFTH